MIRTIIVDDEPLAREGLRVRLALERDIELVGEAGDGATAVSLIKRQMPDLVLLDVQMPGMGGFDVLSRIPQDRMPAVIFVTAHDRYALKAFDVYAVDYLLKPLDGSRLRRAVDRVRQGLQRVGTPGQVEVQTLLAAREQGTPPVAGQYARRWAVRDGEKFVLLRSEEVDWIEAAANYVRFHGRGQQFTLRITMATLEQSLDPRRFARIHRSTIVNLDRVREIKPEWHGDYDVLLTTGETLRLGRRYREGLLG